MDLYLMRHGIAMDREDWLGRPDHERPLVPKGEARVDRVARGLAALGVRFTYLGTSPYVRSMQTAERVARVFGMKDRLRVVEELACGVDAESLVAFLSREVAPGDDALLVGHEPDLGSLVSLFVTGEPSGEFRMKKGGVAKLSMRALEVGRCARLEWLIHAQEEAMG